MKNSNALPKNKASDRKTEFTGMFRTLVDVLSNNESDAVFQMQKLNLYWLDLREYSDSQLRRSVEYLKNTQTFFPKLAQWKQVLDKIKQEDFDTSGDVSWNDMERDWQKRQSEFEADLKKFNALSSIERKRIEDKANARLAIPDSANGEWRSLLISARKRSLLGIIVMIYREEYGSETSRT